LPSERWGNSASLRKGLGGARREPDAPWNRSVRPRNQVKAGPSTDSSPSILEKERMVSNLSKLILEPLVRKGRRSLKGSVASQKTEGSPAIRAELPAEQPRIIRATPGIPFRKLAGWTWGWYQTGQEGLSIAR